MPTPQGRLAWLLVRRPWATLLVAVCVAVLLSCSWLLWRGSIDYSTVRASEPGAVVVDQGTRFRLVELYATQQLADESGEPAPAGPGASWVVARIEVDTRQSELQTDDLIDGPFVSCGGELLGPDRMRWSNDSGLVSRPLSPLCEPGQETVVEQVYRVPSSTLDEIRGVVVGGEVWSLHRWLLRPPG